MSGKNDALDLDKLEALAKAATAGPWRLYRQPPGTVGVVNRNDETGRAVAASSSDANASYIAAMSPDVALAMIARLRAAPTCETCGKKCVVRCGGYCERDE